MDSISCQPTYLFAFYFYFGYPIAGGPLHAAGKAT